MPSILSANTLSSGGYNIDNSMRFNGSDSVMQRNAAGTPSSTRKWSISAWVKRSSTGTNQVYWMHQNASNHSVKFQLGFHSSTDTMRIETYDGSSEYNLSTDMIFRDTNAWYCILVQVDSTQGTEANRYKIFVNGVQVDVTEQGSGYPAQNWDLDLGSQKIALGRYQAASPSMYFDGYLAEVVYADGQIIAPTDIGEFDSDSGIFKPIDVSGLTLGNAGFYINFSDSSDLGAATGNDFALTNLAATDQTTDTPTNNFATINPLDNYFAQATLAEGNTKVTTQASAEAMSTSTFAMTKGKWYFEVDNISGAGARICGITPTPSFQTSAHGKSGDVTPHTISYIGSGKVQEGNGSGGQTELADYNSYDNGNIIGVYMDLDNLKAYFSKDGTLQSATGIDMDSLASNGTGHYMFFVGDNNSGSRVCEANFGNGFQSLSSAVSDDNGYGAFEYSPNITGDSVAKKFYACCTKNLAEFG